MQFFMTQKQFIHLFLIVLICIIKPSYAAVILQYHHVSETLPRVTSVTEQEFEQHMAYLKTHQFTVLPLDEIVNAVKNKTPLPEKTVAITFDDGYKNNFTAAAPILEKYGYPYTIFVNPKLIDENAHYLMTWEELRKLASKGALIANHSARHDYLHHKLANESTADWLVRLEQDIVVSEQRIKQEIGHNYQYLAYPYGEFNQAIENLLVKLNFVGFGQHSGAFGNLSELTRIPRFPASGRYANLSALRDKLNSLPFSYVIQQEPVTHSRKPEVSIHFEDMPFNREQLVCYISGQGKGEATWISEHELVVKPNKALSTGRARYNCTAPNKKKPNRYHWLSVPWVILSE